MAQSGQQNQQNRRNRSGGGGGGGRGSLNLPGQIASKVADKLTDDQLRALAAGQVAFLDLAVEQAKDAADAAKTAQDLENRERRRSLAFARVKSRLDLERERTALRREKEEREAKAQTDAVRDLRAWVREIVGDISDIATLDELRPLVEDVVDMDDEATHTVVASMFNARRQILQSEERNKQKEREASAKDTSGKVAQALSTFTKHMVMFESEYYKRVTARLLHRLPKSHQDYFRSVLGTRGTVDEIKEILMMLARERDDELRLQIAQDLGLIPTR